MAEKKDTGAKKEGILDSMNTWYRQHYDVLGNPVRPERELKTLGSPAEQGLESDRVDERFAEPYPRERYQNPNNKEWPEWKYRGESGEPPLRPIPLLPDEHYSGMQDPSGYKNLSKEEVMEMTMALPEGVKDTKGFVDRAADLKQHHIKLGIPFHVSTALRAIGGFLTHKNSTWDKTGYEEWVKAGGHGAGGGIPPTYEEYRKKLAEIEGPRHPDKTIQIGSPSTGDMTEGAFYTPATRRRPTE